MSTYELLLHIINNCQADYKLYLKNILKLRKLSGEIPTGIEWATVVDAYDDIPSHTVSI